MEVIGLFVIGQNSSCQPLWQVTIVYRALCVIFLQLIFWLLVSFAKEDSMLVTEGEQS